MNSAVATILGMTALALAACDVDQTKEGEMPKVEVNASGGQLPEYEVEGPEVEVGTQNATVAVPEVDVRTENKTIEVPKVDVDAPD